MVLKRKFRLFRGAIFVGIYLFDILEILLMIMNVINFELFLLIKIYMPIHPPFVNYIETFKIVVTH